MLKWSNEDRLISEIREWSKNPRIIGGKKFEDLITSMDRFGYVDQIVINTDGELIGGHARLQKLKQDGETSVSVRTPDRKLNEAEFNELAIRLNKNIAGEWDFDALLKDFDSGDLTDWGFDELDFSDISTDISPTINEEEINEKLTEVFIIPPFSILDTRQGYWLERKQMWKSLINDNGESRESTLYKSKGDPVSEKIRNTGTVSILDPVLAEISLKWFNINGGKAFDCFAGDSVFGFVSSYLGHNFTGIELRKQQVDLNQKRIDQTKTKSRYICDDGQNVGKHIKPETQDLLFSCPPYFNLEVYSDLPDDASNQGSYGDFMLIIENAFSDAIKCLKNDRFAIIVCGDIRTKKGDYHRFPDHLKDLFIKNGMVLYNELILVEPISTSRLRARPNMRTRKVVKTHQNVLVFYKGDMKKIKENFPEIEVVIESENMEP